MQKRKHQLSRSSAHDKQVSRRRRHMSWQKRAQIQILVMLAFFSISVGLWENFRQLWLQKNGFTATEISNVTSLGTVVSVIGIILAGNFLRMRHLRVFMGCILTSKVVFLALLAVLNGSELPGWITFCLVVDVVTTNLIVISVYPLITTIIKNNRVYSQRKLVEYLFRDIGVLIGSLLISQRFSLIILSYNGCLAVSIAFLVIATILMFNLQARMTEREPSRRLSTFKYVKNYILKDRLQRVYMIYAYLAATSFAAALGLKMLMLTNQLHFSVSVSTDFLLIVGLLSDIIGIAALKFFTPKNDYLTIFLKFGIRLLIFIAAIFSNDVFMMLIAITWTLLSSTAYEDVSDGHYINVIPNHHQFRYGTVKNVVTYLGEATGLLFAGWMYNYGIPHILAISAAFTLVQISVAYYLIYLRHHPRHRSKLAKFFKKPKKSPAISLPQTSPKQSRRG